MAKKEKSEEPTEKNPVEQIKKEVEEAYTGGHDYISRLHKKEEDGNEKKEVTQKEGDGK